MIPCREKVKIMNEMACRIAQMQNEPYPVNYPTRLAVCLTTACNYKCIMCNQSHKKNHMSEAFLDKLDEALPFAREICLTGGEPMLHPRFFHYAEKFNAHGVKVRVNTNGSLLGQADNIARAINCLDEIRISIDAASPETYQKIRRGGNFNTVIENVLKLSKMKEQLRVKTPKLVFTYVCMRSNVHELSKLVQIAKYIGVSEIHANYMICFSEDKSLLDEVLYGCQRYSNQEIVKAKLIADNLSICFRMPTLFDLSLGNKGGQENSRSATIAQQPHPCAWPWEYLELRMGNSSAICCGGAKGCQHEEDENFDSIWNAPQRRLIRKTVGTPAQLQCCYDCRGSTGRSANVTARNFVTVGDFEEIEAYLQALPDPGEVVMA